MEEYLDVCDNQGNPTGERVLRWVAHREGIHHRTAHVWCLKEQNGIPYVLLQKRALTKDSFPGKWDTSSAGHIPAGEEPKKSALRELQEELGLSLEVEALHFCGTFDIGYEKMFHDSLFRDSETAFVYVCYGPYPNQFELQEEELEDAMWWPLEEVLSCVRQKDDRFCVPREGLELAYSYYLSHGILT